MSRTPSKDLIALAALFTASGTLHLLRPRHFESIVPHALPRKRELVYTSGVAELVCAAGLLHPRTRKVAGLASAGLLVSIFPANVQMTADVFKRRGRVAQVVAVARLPMQLPMIHSAWRAWRTA